MGQMHNPPHPGEILKADVIDALGLAVPEAATRLAISQGELSEILAGRIAISTDLAVRLEQAGFSTAKSWLAMQSNFDMARVGGPSGSGQE